MRKSIKSFALLAAAVALSTSPAGTARADIPFDKTVNAANHTVTFVNRSGRTVWVGSTVNADASVNFTSLPTLANGQSATVTIPESAEPGHWRGKFFARQGCTGTSGQNFHCAVG